MALRTRLSLAFVFVVLVPVVVGAILAAVVAPHVLRTQQSERLRIADASVNNVVASRCVEAGQAAQLLGLEVAALGPDQAVGQAVAGGGVDYAVVQGANGQIVASAGSLAGAPTPTPGPDMLGSCADGKHADFAISARAKLALASDPSLREAAVAWSVDPSTAASISADLDGHPAVTLLSGSTVVSSTLSPAAAARQARAVTGHSGGVLDAGSRVLAFSPASARQPYGVIVSEPQPDTTKLAWLLVAVVAFTIAVGLSIGRWLARLISRPVMELSEAAGRVASGDLDITIPVRSRDEVGRLAGAFNDMTAELRTYVGELEQSRDELRRNLERLGATLTHTHDLGGILAVVLDTAIGSVQATGGAIMFLNPDGELSVKVRCGEAANAMPDDAVVPLGAGITGGVARSGQPICGVVGEGPGLRPAPQEPAATTIIAVPLKQSGRIVGVLNLYDKEDGRTFSPHDLDVIVTFAGQASVAIDNVLLHQEAQRLSLTDPLTSLWNYRYLTIGLGHEIERATRFERPLAVLMLDLDRFKQINDQHGHQIGDAVLIELATRMRDEVREVDTLARYGGEEFVVVLPETDAAGAARTAERLGAVIRGSRFCAGTPHSLVVTASIGVAIFPDHGSTPSQLLRSADDALYRAKAAGRDCWRFATASDIEPSISLATPGNDDEAAVRAFDETSPLAHADDEAERRHEGGESDGATGARDADGAGRPGDVVVMPDAQRPQQPHGPQV